jgi:uncharacterized protein (UPF0218 family)
MRSTARPHLSIADPRTLRRSRTRPDRSKCHRKCNQAPKCRPSTLLGGRHFPW